jgi:hypothetical protein
MAPGCSIFFDGGPDGYWEREEVRSFRKVLDDDPCFVASVVPMHKEQLIVVRIV